MAEVALQSQDQQINSLSIIDNIDLDSVKGTLSKINQFQMVIQNTLKADHDYGIIPGTTKPTLLKPGAEKILMLMGLTSEYEVTERVQDYENGFFAFTVRCELFKNGVKITEGVGHCNTKEKKYANQDPYTLANTCLKMAKKRAQIDATLTVASLSEVFTQDIEDMQEFLQQEKLETMTPTDAANAKVTFGKYKGKTLREIYKVEKTYINWLSQNAKDPVLKQAAQTVLDGLKEHQDEQEKKKRNKEQSQEPVQSQEQPTSESEILDLFDGGEIEISDEELPFK
jgi:hypothetical protein